eukprot:1760139-Prymnesium_polylepis.1
MVSPRRHHPTALAAALAAALGAATLAADAEPTVSLASAIASSPIASSPVASAITFAGSAVVAAATPTVTGGSTWRLQHGA